jgi:hypothetical protein
MLLDFTNPVLDPRITFSRGTGATRVNASGFIEVVGNTTPRFDYDPVTLAPRGLLIEEARTNLATYSEDFTNAVWSKVDATVTANVTASPDGTTTADLLVPNTSTGQHRIDRNTTIPATVHTWSCFAKAAGYGFVWLRIGSAGAAFDLATGVATTPSGGATVTSQSFGNGWWRFSVSVTAAGNDIVRINVLPSTSTADFAGNGTSGIYLYGAQLEAGAFATSYIPTVASTVSRSADVATMTGTNFSSWYNAAAGTFVTEADTVSSTANAGVIGVGSTASDILRIFRQTDGQPVFQVVTGGVAQATIGLGVSSWPIANAPKVAAAYAANDFAASANGGTVVTDASGTVPTVTQMSIGSAAGVSALNGHIRAIAYYNTRLPNTQLQTLTAPSLASPLALDFLSTSYTVGY